MLLGVVTYISSSKYFLTNFLRLLQFMTPSTAQNGIWGSTSLSMKMMLAVKGTG